MSANGAENSTGDAKETPSADLLKGMFEESLERNPDKLGFSKDEAAKFGKAFEDPEFRKMFGDYMDELQDPANRQETEDYISQLEGENRVPAGKELIRPQTGFVAKTFKIDEELADKKGDKVWMNIVKSTQISKPSSQKAEGGESWSVPYSLGPPHMEKDNNGNNVATFDCCFHPDALFMASQRKAFQGLLVQTAMEGVEEAYKRQKLPTKLSKDFHVLKGVTYKSGVIGTMLVDKQAKEDWEKGLTPEEQRQAAEDAKTKASGGAAGKLASKLTGQSGAAPQGVGAGATKAKPRTKEEVAAAVQVAKKAQAAGKGKAGKDNDPIFQKGFLTRKEKSGSGKSKQQQEQQVPGGKAPLIQEISSTPSAAAAAQKAMGQTHAQPPIPPSDIEQEAEALAARSTAEVKAVRKLPVQTRSGGLLEPDDSVANASPSGPIEPKYSVTERGVVDWGDFALTTTEGSEPGGSRGSKSLRPKELVVRIELPRVGAGQAGAVELDVSEKRVSLKFKEVYALGFSLPYRVDDKKGSAKFEKVKSALVVTLPLAKPTEEELSKQAERTAAAAAAAAKMVTTSAPAKTRANSSPKKDAAAVVADATPTASDDKEKQTTSSPYVSGLSTEEATASASLKAEIAAAAAAAKVQALKDAEQGRLHPQPKTEPAPKQAAPVAAAAGPQQAAEAEAMTFSEPFVKADSFQGARKGYVFKRGEDGVGYYLDAPPHKRKPAAVTAAAKPLTAAAAPSAMASDGAPEVPPLDMRQTPQAVSVVIGLSRIDSSSVQAIFTATGARCSFMAGGKAYAVDLRIPEDKAAAEKQALDAGRCKYDVAKKNMVIVLVKDSACASIWATPPAGQTLLEAHPWADGKPAASTDANAAKSVATKAASSPIKGATDVDALIKQAGSMRMTSSSNHALFDLD